MMAGVAFWKNGSFDEHVLREFSSACVDTKLRSIESICTVSGDRGLPHGKLVFPVRETKTSGGGQ